MEGKGFQKLGGLLTIRQKHGGQAAAARLANRLPKQISNCQNWNAEENNRNAMKAHLKHCVNLLQRNEESGVA